MKILAFLGPFVALIVLSTSFALAQDERPNQTQVCQVVINVIVNNQPIQSGGDDVVISGDGNDLSDNQTAVIAQYFDISPVIVQDCLQQYYGNQGGATGGTSGGTTGGTNGTTGNTGGTTSAGDSQGGTTNPVPSTDNVIDDVDAGDELPDTGAPADVKLALVFVLCGFGLLGIRLLAALRRI